MACNQDSGCLTIAKSTYPGLKNEINSSISNITDSISEIISGLSGLSVPDDYLGSKVKNSINSICSNLSSDEGEVSSIKGNINGFIGDKISEHMEHYREWQRQQELARLRRQRELRDDEGQGRASFSTLVKREDKYLE